MSQRNKLSLWQKIKRFLTTSAPQSVIDGANESAAPVTKNEDDKDLNECHETDSDVSTTHKRTQTMLSDFSADQPHHTPIVEFLKTYFNQKQWHYTYYQPKTHDGQQSHHLSLRMRHKELNCGYLFRVQEESKLLAVYGILPFLIPESHQSAAMLLITQLNYDMLIGNLEMDVNDGEIRYKNAIDVETVGMNHQVVEHLLQSVIAMTTVANELFSNLVNNQEPEADLQTLLMTLRQDADSRTFFLPTQFVQ